MLMRALFCFCRPNPTPPPIRNQVFFISFGTKWEFDFHSLPILSFIKKKSLYFSFFFFLWDM